MARKRPAIVQTCIFRHDRAATTLAATGRRARDRLPMTTPDPVTATPAHSLRAALAHRFSLRDDMADDAEIDRSVRAAVELRGATLWILMLAIVIASVGLNTNSTAVVIGAMLVSPLMGPIVGLGYGISIFDFALMRRALANLAIAAFISLITSTVYFLLSPLAEAQSELLARTTPSLWDVLIALAGGLAGIIGQTRRERSTVIPGVAIATALMPPLCTAGFGLAHGNWHVFGGAFYLFSINSVFIAFSAVIVIDFLRLPRHRFVEPGRERRVKRVFLAIVLLTALPSIYLAVRLVDNELFKSRARAFVHAQFKGPQVHALETRVDAGTRSIEVTLIGPPLSAPVIHAIEQQLAPAGLDDARLSVHQAQAENAPIDVGSLKADILADIVRSSQQALEDRTRDLAALRAQLAAQQVWIAQSAAITREFSVQYPQCTDVLVGRGVLPGAKEVSMVPILSATCSRQPRSAELQRIHDWLKVRTGSADVRILLDHRPRVRSKPRA
jgi:uncharacterized hydrophobic protein (TIGR00271 family)